MYSVDFVPAAYMEERLAADEVKRIAAQQQHQAQHQVTPQNLTQALLQRPPLSGPNSSGFIGSIFQGFVRAASASPSPSQCATPCATPMPGGQAKQVTSAEMEKLIAEQKRDADICAMPSW